MLMLNALARGAWLQTRFLGSIYLKVVCNIIICLYAKHVVKDNGVTTTDVTPEDFAAREEMSQQVGWSVGSVKKTKKKVSSHNTN